MEFLSLIIGITLASLVQALKALGWNVQPKTLIAIISAVVGLIAIFLSPEQTEKIIGYGATGVATASGLYEYFKVFIPKND